MLRLILDGALDGPTNMARDEAMLIEVGNKAAPPTLRLYQWSPPTISLGFFQKFADYVCLPAPAGQMPVVRRLTGGGAILHDMEQTYSLALPTGHDLLRNGANRLYELAHDAVIASLAQFEISTVRCGVSDDSGAARGPFFCFERRHCYDVLLGRDKIAGSAQRRTRHGVLQHGSIVLGNRYAQHSTALMCREADDETMKKMGALRDNFPVQLERVLSTRLIEGNWTAAELESASALIEKYSGDTWNRRVP